MPNRPATATFSSRFSSNRLLDPAGSDGYRSSLACRPGDRRSCGRIAETSRGLTRAGLRRTRIVAEGDEAPAPGQVRDEPARLGAQPGNEKEKTRDERPTEHPPTTTATKMTVITSTNSSEQTTGSGPACGDIGVVARPRAFSSCFRTVQRSRLTIWMAYQGACAPRSGGPRAPVPTRADGGLRSPFQRSGGWCRT
jgi:hypothetical protein